LNYLNKITDGRGTRDDIDRMQEISDAMCKASLCGLGQTAANPVKSTLRYFMDEYLEHIDDKKCRSGKCQKLISYEIDPAKCKGCTICARKCPAGAITGTLKNPHVIDKAKCVKCGACVAACKFGAISVK
jgi:NADP-reducing hydrogenase subunit HndC